MMRSRGHARVARSAKPVGRGPNTLPNHDPQITDAALPHPIDAFFGQIIKNVRKQEADAKRRRPRNKPSFSIPETAKITGLFVHEVRKLIDDQEIDPKKPPNSGKVRWKS